jgi:hypothetical protein
MTGIDSFQTALRGLAINSATRLFPPPPSIAAMGFSGASDSLSLNDFSQDKEKLALATPGDKELAPGPAGDS